MNVALVWPAAMVMLGGTAASALIELERATDVPPAGAAALRVTVPVEVAPLPPEMLDGLRLSDVTIGPGTAAAGTRCPSTTASTTIWVATCGIKALLSAPPASGHRRRAARASLSL